ncbi:MAG: UbiX family flavin prenyltransferase [Candidatus Limnocylindrales bacterium]
MSVGSDPGSAAGGRSFRLIVGISGASGVIYGIRLLEVLAPLAGVETHLVMTAAARQTISLETTRDPRDVEALADVTYRIGDIAASISSGSFPIDAMIVVPCSMGTLSAIANSTSDNLLERAADVTLKERRPLVLVPRESPLHLGHLRLMVQATEIGATVSPPMPAFYNRPQTLDQVVDQTVGRLLDLLHLDPGRPLAPRWSGPDRGPGQRSPTGEGPAQP